MEFRDDPLAELGGTGALSRKIDAVRERAHGRTGVANRLAVALYDEPTDLLKTFLRSDDRGEHPLDHYQARLGESPSLLQVRHRGRPRVIDDLRVFEGVARPHARRIVRQGFGSSLTVPLFHEDRFNGFLFLNAYERGAYTPERVQDLEPFCHLVNHLILNGLNAMRTLSAAVEVASDLSHERDPETGGHLERMSRYARVIALGVAPAHGLDDERVETILRFARLHDIGKLAVPDEILLKPGPLTAAEFATMTRHTTRGRELVDRIIRRHALDALPEADVLRHIVESHHEALDGSGYPRGLRGPEIPIEARICAVADIFDALTSHRPYKAAWSNREALATLEAEAGSKLDPDCVQALRHRWEEIERIQDQFRERGPTPQ